MVQTHYGTEHLWNRAVMVLKGERGLKIKKNSLFSFLFFFFFLFYLRFYVKSWRERSIFCVFLLFFFCFCLFLFSIIYFFLFKAFHIKKTSNNFFKLFPFFLIFAHFFLSYLRPSLLFHVFPKSIYFLLTKQNFLN